MGSATLPQADSTKPYAEILVYLPDDIADQFLSTLALELDDGRYCYFLNGQELAMASRTDGWQYHLSPRVNTLDSGTLIFRFSLTDTSGATLISDTSFIELCDDRHWSAGLLCFAKNPCQSTTPGFGCRLYELPEQLHSARP